MVSVNVGRINDVVDVWAYSIRLKDPYIINIIKEDIIKRCQIYKKTIPFVSVSQDPCQAYIIKPVNGKYELEDFFLNRLMLGVRNIVIDGSFEDMNADYNTRDKDISINITRMKKSFDDASTRHSGLAGKRDKIILKSIEHELGHVFKTTFTDGVGEPGKSNLSDAYKRAIINMSLYKNGKYANQVKKVNDFDFSKPSFCIKTGVKDSMEMYRNQNRFVAIDEVLNEREALLLAGNNEVHEKKPLEDPITGKVSKSGNYINVYNYLSGYRCCTGYGEILRGIMGSQPLFEAEYISSKEIFKKIDNNYADIVQEVWGLNPKTMPPIECLIYDFYELYSKKPHFDEKRILKLDEFFAKCYEKLIDKEIQRRGAITSSQARAVLSQIELFRKKLTTNDDPKKRDALPHNVVFTRMLKKINIALNANTNNYANATTNNYRSGRR